MNVFITGVTGFVGGELLVNLSKRKEVDKIFCLIRATDEPKATVRLQHVFDIHNDFFDKSKVFPVLGDLFDEHLTTSLINNKELKDIDVIIHSAANTSFSKIYDKLVEQTNLGGLEKILLWAKQLTNLSTFYYIGTATICGEDIKNRTIFEDESPNLNARHFVKYTYTKMHGELMLHKHLPEEKILIARPSIIMGDSRPILPRSPVILWALATLNHLRLVPVNKDSKLDIIPVDYAAKAITSLLFSKRNHRVYHISSGEASATTPYKVLKAIEPYFNSRPDFHFVERSMLQQMKFWSKSSLKPDSELHSHPEFIKYWEHEFESAGMLRIIFAGLEPYLSFIELGQVFDNSRLMQDSDVGPSIPADIYITDEINFIEDIDVFEGAKDP